MEHKPTLVQIEILKRNLGFLQKNYDELILHLEKYQDPDFTEELWNGLTSNLDDYAFEVSRLLLNFVAMAKAIVDINRRMIRNWYGEDARFITTYHKKIDDTFTNNPLVQFVHCSRNYVLHFDLITPNLKVPLSYRQVSDSNCNGVVLRKSKLINYSGYSIIAKRFLNESSEYIDLEEIVEEYYQEIYSFYEWLFASIARNQE